MFSFKLSTKALFISLLLVLVACKAQDEAVQVLPPEEVQQDSIAYLALGDSYTIGQGVMEPERWPNQLSVQLEENDFPVKETRIIAKTGWTTRNLLDAIDDAELGDYNLVSLLIGVNNQFQSKPFELFETEFEELIDQSIQLAGSIERVFVVSIPDYGVTPFGSSNSEEIGEEIDMYNAHIASRCAALNIPFIDITEISRDLGSSSGALATDNLHPSGLQYGKWVEKILPTVLGIVIE